MTDQKDRNQVPPKPKNKPLQNSFTQPREPTKTRWREILGWKLVTNYHK